jgi:hypothetical protein
MNGKVQAMFEKSSPTGNPRHAPIWNCLKSSDIEILGNIPRISPQ